MSSLSLELRQHIISLAGPREWGMTRQSWLFRAARAADINYHAAKALFYCDRENPSAKLVDAVRAAIAKKTLEQEAQARNEYRELKERIARLEAALALADETFHQPSIDGLRSALHGLGGTDRAGGDDRTD